MTTRFQKLMPRKYPARDCWTVVVPASLAGRRKRFFYPTEAEALRGSAEIALQIDMGVVPASTGTQTRIAALAASYLARREGVVGYDTQRQSKWGLKLFCDRFGTISPEQVTKQMVEAWVASLPLETRGKFNAFSVARAFFNTLDLPAPFKTAPLKQDKGHRLDILTVEQARALVEFDFPDWFRCWLLGGMFAGMRTCEMHRISHEAIDWEFKEIIIRKEDSKGGRASRPRSISIQDAYSRHMPLLTGAYLSGKTNREMEPYWKKAAKLLDRETYPKNILRHTFATMHLAFFKSAPTTAFEMGHTSPSLIYSAYANAVSRREAQQFWEI